MLRPPEVEDEQPRIVQAIRRGEPLQQFETDRLRKDGTRISVSLTVSPIRDSAGRIVGASRIARDITQQKRWNRPCARAKPRLGRFSTPRLTPSSRSTARRHRDRSTSAAERLFGYRAQ